MFETEIRASKDGTDAEVTPVALVKVPNKKAGQAAIGFIFPIGGAWDDTKGDDGAYAVYPVGYWADGPPGSAKLAKATVEALTAMEEGTGDQETAEASIRELARAVFATCYDKETVEEIVGQLRVADGVPLVAASRGVRMWARCRTVPESKTEALAGAS